MQVTELICQNCGAKLEAQPGQVMIKCRYCGTSSHVDWQERERPQPPPPQPAVTTAQPVAWPIAPKYIVLFVVLMVVFPLAAKLVSGEGEATTSSRGLHPSTSASSRSARATKAPPVPQTPEQARLAAVDVKVTAYVRSCLNPFVDYALSSRADYRSWVSDEAGPTPRARRIRGLPRIQSFGDCIEAVESARAVEPAIEPLDTAAADFARELGMLGAIVDEANRYYAHNDYADDNMAHGAEMHRPLLEAFDRFIAATTALEVAIDPLFDELLTARMTSPRDRDVADRLFYGSLRTAFEIATTGNVNWRNLEEIDLETYEAKVSGFEGMVATLRAEGHHPSYASAADNFARVAKQLLRRVRNNREWTRSERADLVANSERVGGSPGAMIYVYNQLADKRTSPPLRHVRLAD